MTYDGDDIHFVARMRPENAKLTADLANHAEDFVRLLRAAEEVTRLVFDTDSHVPLSVSAELCAALAAFEEGQG